jgi:hypothetical protein
MDTKQFKEDLIKAIKETIKEYREDRHVSNKLYCEICKTTTSCHKCIYTHFACSLGCIDRQCMAKSSASIDTSHKNKLIAFHTRTIKWLKRIQHKEFENLRSDRFKHIVKIDKEVYEEYNS